MNSGENNFVIEKKSSALSVGLSIAAFVLAVIGGIGYWVLQFILPILALLLSPVAIFVLLVSIVMYIFLPFVLLSFAAVGVILFAFKLACIALSFVAAILGVISLVVSLTSGGAKERVLSVAAIAVGGVVVLTSALLVLFVLALITVIALITLA